MVYSFTKKIEPVANDPALSEIMLSEQDFESLQIQSRLIVERPNNLSGLSSDISDEDKERYQNRR